MARQVIRGNWKRLLHVSVRTLLIGPVVVGAVYGLRSRNADPPIARGAQATTDDAAFDSARVDAFIVANLQRTGLPGVALAITRNDQVVYTAGYGGDARGAALTPDTPMLIGSMSKSMPAFAVLLLVEQGRVDLDAPVVTYLPSFQLADPRGGQITVRQLLQQDGGMADAGFPEMELPQPQTLEEATARLRVARLVAAPGTQFNYHNPNYMVLARLVEVVGGEPFAQYMQSHVFGPLDMSRSRTVDRAEATRQWAADGHISVYGQQIAVPILPHFFNGSGGVTSTANDMANWLIVQNNGGTTRDGRALIEPGSVELMHTPSRASGDYAMGWERDVFPDGTVRIEHGGTPFTYSSDQALFPQSGYAFALLFNSSSAIGVEQISFIDGLTDIILGQTPALGVPAATIADGVLLALTVCACVDAVSAVRRAPAWATRRRTRPRWRRVVALGRSLVPLMVLVAFPTLAGLVFGDRDVTWLSSVYGWLALVVLVAAFAVCRLVVGVVRLIAVVCERRTTGGVSA